MKLPGINYTTPVSSFGRQDINLPARLAEAESAAFDQFADFAMTAAAVYDTYDRNRAENAYKDNMLELQKRSLYFHAQFDQQDFYSAADFPNVPGLEQDTREMIPAHELRPMVYQHFMMEQIQELSGNIHRNDYKTDWIREADSKLTQQVGRFTLESVATQKEARLEQLAIDNANLIQDGYYDLALMNNANNRDVYESEQDFITVQQKMEKSAESHQYAGIRRRDNLEELTNTRNFLQQDQKDYAAQGGMLTEGEREAELNAINRQINAHVKASEGQAQVEANRMQAGFVEKTFLGLKGYPMTIESTQEMDAIAPGMTKTERRNWEDAKRYNNTIHAFNLAPMDEQAEVIRKMEMDPNLGPAEAALLSYLKDAYQDKQTELNKNMMNYAVRTGVANPVPLDLSSPQTWQETLTQRLEEYNKARGVYPDTTGPLLPGEAETLSAAFTGASPNNQLQFIMGAYMADPALGTKIFDQITEEDPRAFQTAAKLVADGRNTIALNILEGIDRLDQLPDKKNIRQQISDELGSMYAHDTQRRRSTLEAALGLYSYLSSEGAEPDDINDVIEAVTGGRINYNDVLITAPSSIVNSTQFHNFVAQVDDKYIDELGGVDGLSSLEFTMRLHEGEFILRDAGMNGYHVIMRDRINQNVLRRADNPQLPFILHYDDKRKISPGERSLRIRDEFGSGFTFNQPEDFERQYTPTPFPTFDEPEGVNVVP